MEYGKQYLGELEEMNKVIKLQRGEERKAERQFGHLMWTGTDRFILRDGI